MLVFPLLVAVKIAVAVLISLLPLGLAVLFHGARKSPLLGLLGLGLVWGNLTHWGFLTYVAALGLFAMVVGFTLLVLDRPTRGRQVGLALSLVALFFSHIYRFPFAVAAVAGTAIVMYPATRRVRPLALPVLPALILFAVWWAIRPPALEAALTLSFHPERFHDELAASLTGGFVDSGVTRTMHRFFDAGWLTATVCAALALVERARRRRTFTAWDVGVTMVPLACAAVFLVLFLVMPLWLGTWWYVYPREATAAALVLCGACPDLPRRRWARAAFVALIALPAVDLGHEVASRYAEFDAPGEEFHQITRRLPLAPKLFYMILDHSGTSRSTSPFMHLPAYVQAEKGGWLSWHLARWGHAPVTYRPPDDPDAVLAPAAPPAWEWYPEQLYDPRMTSFFDWFLVREKEAPDDLFAHDPSIVRVDQVGPWWLYERRR
jgi:hypothetical protein